ncbi:squalene/phytoene synthase family protein [Parvibaculum sedimenti]|uniref:Squalene/phytoene synthase family protein n=2 Tax=Parvibaculum sedimenti TaxID=2608632 RepID=A0A6N6VG11_9HYPH|nr:squalene/phytoene synthase family protein [Parvibaculum sedimenti]KAB7739646.1 squalene/phytoene synthase family protein [Parvibaculum sedimenti]
MDQHSTANSLRACLNDVRRLDHDRFLSLQFVPSAKRPALIALYAFNAEIARVPEVVSEPMLGQIRLQWWRDTVEALSDGEARGHETAVALAETRSVAHWPQKELIALIDARERDLDEAPFDSMAELESYAEETSSRLMMLAAQVLAGESTDMAAAAIKSAGVAYALTGLLRALPLHASQGRLYLPLDLLRSHDIDPHRIFAGEMSETLRNAIGEVATRARALLAGARAHKVDRAAIPALLPAALCDRYLRMVTAPGFDPFRQSTDVPAFSRQLRMAAKQLAGRF